MNKKYKANSELAQVLFKHGLENYSPISFEKRGKKLFRKSESSLKAVIFDYETIRIENGTIGLDEKIELNTAELKYLLLYLNLPKTDWDVIDGQGFKWSEMDERLDILRNELRQLKELDITGHRRKKIETILTQYDSLLMES